MHRIAALSTGKIRKRITHLRHRHTSCEAGDRRDGACTPSHVSHRFISPKMETIRRAGGRGRPRCTALDLAAGIRGPGVYQQDGLLPSLSASRRTLASIHRKPVRRDHHVGTASFHRNPGIRPEADLTGRVDPRYPRPLDRCIDKPRLPPGGEPLREDEQEVRADVSFAGGSRRGHDRRARAEDRIALPGHGSDGVDAERRQYRLLPPHGRRKEEADHLRRQRRARPGPR